MSAAPKVKKVTGLKSKSNSKDKISEKLRREVHSPNKAFKKKKKMLFNNLNLSPHQKRGANKFWTNNCVCVMVYDGIHSLFYALREGLIDFIIASACVWQG
jgi:hypothetical protein